MGVSELRGRKSHDRTHLKDDLRDMQVVTGRLARTRRRLQLGEC